ncbi:MAG: DHH family phosphoesterase [Candidatus Woesearchaeota archaeon]
MNNKNNNRIVDLKPGDQFDGIVKIIRKAKPGPVIFSVTDGTMSIDAVTKDSKFESDDVVRLEGFVTERQGRMQIEIIHMEKSNKDFDKILAEQAKLVRTEFSIKSKRYDLMSDKFIKIAERIRLAIITGEPILIRHHNDADGITSGLTIEIACKQLMEKRGIDPSHNLYRSPSRAPFYEIADVFRDWSLSNRIVSFDQKKPLIIVVDNGSTPEDKAGFQILKALGHHAIVIDHHNPVIIKDGKTSVCEYLDLHLNPYMYGLDSKTSAGMLCYELSRFISEDFDNPVMPAAAAIADRCDIEETESYIKNSRLTREDLTKIGVAIDFAAYQMKFDSGNGIFEELYNNMNIVKILNDQVTKGVETQLQSTLPYLRTQEINGVIFSHIDLEKYTLRFTYPTPGKVLGMIHDQIALGKENTPVLTIGYVSDMIIIRATHPVLPVHTIIEKLQKKQPHANVDGGGHEMAGTIKFVTAHLTTIIEFIKDELKKIKND